MEMGSRKLKVQRAIVNSKSLAVIPQVNQIPTNSMPGKSNFSEQIPMEDQISIEIPLYASLPSRVIQMINMITAEDVMDDLEYREIVEDIRNVF
jgi:hypothetical protein